MNRTEWPAWMALAACRGLVADVFYAPETERGYRKLARERVAKSICSTCPVVGDCLEYAVANDERHGVWGSLTEDERKGLKVPA